MLLLASQEATPADLVLHDVICLAMSRESALEVDLARLNARFLTPQNEVERLGWEKRTEKEALSLATQPVKDRARSKRLNDTPYRPRR